MLLGRSVDHQDIDTVTIDNVAAGRQATNYLLDLGHTRIGIDHRPHAAVDRQRPPRGHAPGHGERGLAPRRQRHPIRRIPRGCRLFGRPATFCARPDRPTALYVANGVMALGVMRAIADLNLRCPEDISIASTDTISGIGGLKPRLTRTEHPDVEMTKEALRMLIDRIDGGYRRAGPQCRVPADAGRRRKLRAVR